MTGERSVTLREAADFLQECEVLGALLASAGASDWLRATQFKGWSCEDILGHLMLFDRAALATLESEEGFAALLAPSYEYRKAGGAMREWTRAWLRGLAGAALRERWLESARELAARYRDVDPARRLKWGSGPTMSARSLVSARQMETWAHGQAAFDAFGRVRSESDRLRNIAVMGVNTFGWSFVNRKLEIPARKPQVRLTSPSGACWEWNEPDPGNLIEGEAVEFCQVVTQTRNVGDTRLRVLGDGARAWMSIAQCFAGPPEDPPPAGTRFLQHPA